MNQVQTVNPDFIAQVWDKVAPYLQAGLATGIEDCTIEQLKTILMQGKQTLLVSVKDEEINGAMTIEIFNSPNQRVAHITSLGGKGVVDKDTFAQVEVWAKAQGVTRVRAWACEAQAKLYKRNAEFNTTRFVVEKVI